MRLVAWLLWALLTVVSVTAQADEAPEREDPKVVRARALFVEGAALAKKTLWGEALARFEASAALRDHAGTSYNIGICQRALGRYTRARASFRRALAQQAADPDALAASTVETIETYLAEIERVLAVLVVDLAPPDARVSVDGRPLKQTANGELPTLTAGIATPGPGSKPPARRFRVVLDPGAHVFLLAREGFGDAVVRRSVLPGSRGKLDLRLARLPATLSVEASEDRAAVKVDGVDVGLAPVRLLRPRGRYHVEVAKEGFELYETDVRLRPAQQVDLTARLEPEVPGLHERWWFWTTVVGSLATVAVTTYVVTRPTPDRPPLDGGNLGWAIRVP